MKLDELITEIEEEASDYKTADTVWMFPDTVGEVNRLISYVQLKIESAYKAGQLDCMDEITKMWSEHVTNSGNVFEHIKNFDLKVKGLKKVIK